ncbi:hypothetical protein GCM10027445_44890 [Amycolatopsis endophytica]|uniref:Secreted protein n=1 Tax=Amycolatopsis endophytica TaxID=860233 RepID=A0A853B104_9PSEU|nr:hypothetical protein [Amycolatopsis endophytica]NYI88619.1 hypothetical protein [Amycolatopsis endophytica]
MRIAQFAAATVALTAAAVVATTGTASAAVEPPGDGWDHTFKASGVVVYVEENGDRISICDTAANGKRAQLDVWIGSDPIYSSVVTKGKGSCVTHSASQGGKYNLPEGKQIVLAFFGNGYDYRAEESFVNDH